MPDFDLLEKHCEARIERFAFRKNAKQMKSDERAYIAMRETGIEANADNIPPAWHDWKTKIRLGHGMLMDTLWEVANEFNPAGFGQGIISKLTTNWCECGCSWDWLGEVCLFRFAASNNLTRCAGQITEQMFKDDEDSRPTRTGKEREWDGRGSGVPGWNTEEESDVWLFNLQFKQRHENVEEDGEELHGTGQLVQLRYIDAERSKEEVCAFAGHLGLNSSLYFD